MKRVKETMKNRLGLRFLSVAVVTVGLGCMPQVASAQASRPASQPAKDPNVGIGHVVKGPKEFLALIERSPNPQVIDLRTEPELQNQLLPHAKVVTYRPDTFEKLAASKIDKSRPVLIYCRSGRRSARAAKVLLSLGFKDVADLKGGILAWQASGLKLWHPKRDRWNRRYAGAEYVYGKNANAFLIQELAKLKAGEILFPGEGEGRNAVYAAKKGWKVHAYDISDEGQKKAQKLAKEHKVSINYFIADFSKPGTKEASYDAAAVCYLHLPVELRAPGFKALIKSLKPGGVLILECFSKQHLELKRPFGPRSAELLYSKAELKELSQGLDIVSLVETKVELDEGGHKGPAWVVRLVAKKPTK